MASTTSSPSGFLSSPRTQQRLLWISGAVLVIGVAIFLGVFLSRGNTKPTDVSTVSSGPATDTTQSSSVKVPASASALQVARTFLETAVLRTNLDTAYGITGPYLKGGMSLAQWRKGSIPVQPYPARNAKTAQLQVSQSTKSHLMLVVALAPRSGLKVKPLAFWLGLDRIHGRWLVNYWLPDYDPLKSQANPYSN